MCRIRPTWSSEFDQIGSECLADSGRIRPTPAEFVTHSSMLTWPISAKRRSASNRAGCFSPDFGRSFLQCWADFVQLWPILGPRMLAKFGPTSPKSGPNSAGRRAGVGHTDNLWRQTLRHMLPDSRPIRALGGRFGRHPPLQTSGPVCRAPYFSKSSCPPRRSRLLEEWALRVPFLLVVS